MSVTTLSRINMRPEHIDSIEDTGTATMKLFWLKLAAKEDRSRNRREMDEHSDDPDAVDARQDCLDHLENVLEFIDDVRTRVESPDGVTINELHDDLNNVVVMINHLENLESRAP